MARAGADQQTVRRHNLRLVLAAVHRLGAASRAQVAVATGLTKATVSAQVDTLLGAGILAEAAAAPVGPGRPGRPLSLGPYGPVGIGVEIGVDAISTCLVDLAGRVRYQHARTADNRDVATTTVLRRAARAVHAAAEQAGALGTPVAGVGVAVPGLVAAGEGVVALAPNLGWRDVPVGAPLAVAGAPVRVGNEASHAALGELWFGGHGDLTDFVLVSAGIGVGAGLVRSGALVSGVHGFAGEIGHLTVDPAGPPCPCGSRGCLERVAGQEAILATAGVSTLDALVERLGARDRRALSAVRRAGRALGLALANTLGMVDVPAVVLSGAYPRLAPWLVPQVEAEIARRVVWTQWTPVRVLCSGLGPAAAVRGSAGIAVRAVLADPGGWLDRANPTRPQPC